VEFLKDRGSILFLIFINNLDSDVMSLMLKFADDTKSYEDRQLLQQALDRLAMWADEWLMQFNEKKYKSMYIGNGASGFNYKIIENTDKEKDLGD